MSEGAFFDPGVQEFFVSHFVKHETVEGDLVRLYFGKTMRGRIVVEYTVLVPITCLAVMSRQCLAICAEQHNVKVMDGVEAVH